MATGSPCVATDIFGEQWTAYTDEDDVYVGSDLTAAVLAFQQPVEDSPIDLDIAATNALIITYLDADGNRLTKESDDDGETWA